MEIVVFEDGDTNADQIRKLKAEKGPVEIHIKAHGGEVPCAELMALMDEKVAKSRIEVRSIASLIAAAGHPKEKFYYKFLDQ